MNTFTDTLKKMSLFQNISPSMITGLEQQLKKSLLNYQKGSILKLQGEAVYGLLFLLEGEITIELSSLHGKTLQLKRLKAPEVISPVFMTGKNALPVLIRSTSKSSLSILPKVQFYKWLQQVEPLLENFLSLVASRISYLARKIEFLNFNTIRKKLIYFLLELPKTNTWLRLPMSISELAEFFGVERPSLSTVLGSLVHEGLISKNGNKEIRILKMDALRAELE